MKTKEEFNKKLEEFGKELNNLFKRNKDKWRSWGENHWVLYEV